MLSNLLNNELSVRNSENNKATDLMNKKSHIYFKRGPEKLNEINLIYGLTTCKKNSEYIGKLSDILHNCRNVENYSFKRINLDQAIYKINQNNELYLTLPNFLQNHRANTMENKNNKQKVYKKHKVENWNMNKIFDRNSQLNQSIYSFSTNKNQKITEEMRKNIYNELKKKYNFEKDNEKFKIPKSPNDKKLFPKINYNFQSFANSEKCKNKKNEIRDEIIHKVKCINKKSLDFNSLKSRDHFKLINLPAFYIKKKYSLNRSLDVKNNDDINVRLNNNNGVLLKKMESEINEIVNYVN